MPLCVPMKDLKDTAAFTRTVEESAEAVYVTKNGREAFVAMTPERYDALRLEASRAKLYQAIDRAEADIAAGRLVDAAQSIDAARDRYGL